MKYNRPQATTPVTEISNEEFDALQKDYRNAEIPKPDILPVKEEPKVFDRTAVTTVNVRKDPDKDSPSLGVLYPNTTVKAETFDQDWYKVVSGDYKGGYVRRPFLK